ncbi:uncharacterized protein KY384_007118 [Bacidia gigantensis]|uniref:uncharacterized protein n=1 Tax=Bacidia gigantensis TaxID=2732470 RepID=UPI001D040D33|nr:uncharacterized protein KY384_007118 [Bacidia gigantensis]KAG8528201.1 hypothetical protein KY384_007118 [Bacidia gigantensis]
MDAKQEDFGFPSPKRQRVLDTNASASTEDLNEVDKTSDNAPNTPDSSTTLLASSHPPPSFSISNEANPVPFLPGLNYKPAPQMPPELDKDTVEGNGSSQTQADRKREMDQGSSSTTTTKENNISMTKEWQGEENISNDLGKGDAIIQSFRDEKAAEAFESTATSVGMNAEERSETGQRVVHGEFVGPPNTDSSATHPPKPEYNPLSNSEILVDGRMDADISIEEAEFELDSSPIESSDTDSSETSSFSDDDPEDDYNLLNPEEQMARLMKEEAGSDDETAIGKTKTNQQVRSVNEEPEEEVPIPQVEITEATKIEELGQVEHIMKGEALIKAKTSGEYRVLEFGSLLCLETRVVIGVVTETIGRVQQPYYIVRGANSTALSDVGLSTNDRVFYVVDHSKYIFTAPLQAVKGSDASNLHDEEISDGEREFSDDEAEAEYKRRVKFQKKFGRDGGPRPGEGFSRAPRGPRGRGRGGYVHRNAFNDHRRLPPSNQSPMHEMALNYDDASNSRHSAASMGDDLYTPLTRPKDWQATWHQETPPLPPQSSIYRPSPADQGRGRGRGRGKVSGQFNSRESGASRPDFQANGNVSTNGFPSAPSPHATRFIGHQTQPQQYQSGQQPYPFPAPIGSGSTYQPAPPTTMGPPFQQQVNHPYNNYYQQPYASSDQSTSGPYGRQQPPPQPTGFSHIPPGAHINPAFFTPQAQNTYPNPWSPQSSGGNYRHHH